MHSRKLIFKMSAHTHHLLLPILIAFSLLIIPSNSAGIAVYWGQNGYEGDLSEACSTGYYKYALIAFLTKFGHGVVPELNLAGHCDPPSGTCARFSTDIKLCQNLGVKVFLSLGGSGNVDYYLDSPENARHVADYLWNNFLGGQSTFRPLGDAILDGIDFDIEATSSLYWDVLAEFLSNYSTPERRVYLSAAPQCLIPDAMLDTAIRTGLFDYVWIQFYNNPQCDYRGRVDNLVASWKKWNNYVPAGQIFLGLPAASNGAPSGGYIAPEIVTCEVLPAIKSSSNYGGVMLWNRYYDMVTEFGASIKPYLNENQDPDYCNRTDIGIKDQGMAVYWGQHRHEGDLSEACATGYYEYAIIAFLTKFGHGSIPELNLAGHCDPPSGTCTRFSTDIKLCQNLGVKVLLSLGGSGNVDYYLDSPENAKHVADYLWNNFLGGHSTFRPLGDAVLDGIDFDIEVSSPLYWDVLAGALSKYSTPGRRVYLSAAPRCPMPDAMLGTTIRTGLFDYVWIQFYNNPQCDYRGGVDNLVASWNKWNDYMHAGQIFLGLLAASNGAPSGGYIPPEIVTCEVLPAIKSSTNYGGVMLWNRYYDMVTEFSSSIKPYLNKNQDPDYCNHTDIGINDQGLHYSK